MSQQEFYQALLAAQKEFPPISKGRTADIKTSTGSYSYSYADLGDILDAVLPILHKHGIAFSQPPVAESGLVGVRTRLIHESGHVEECGALLLPAGNNPQATGSAMTYARRYAACAALGIVADEDDDGKAAMPATEPPTEEELAKRGTNKLKAEALEITGDANEAQALWDSVLLRENLIDYVDGPVPVEHHEAVRKALREMGP